MIPRFRFLLLTALSICGPCLAGPTEPNANADIRLCLAFPSDQSLTYEYQSYWERSVAVKTTNQQQSFEIPSGPTGSYVTIRFTQTPRSIDPNGNALLDIRIESLKAFEQKVGDPVIDFDSLRDKDGTLARLVGATYQIRLSPKGRVLAVIGLTDLHKIFADQASDPARKAAELTSLQFIRDMHTVFGLADLSTGPCQLGQSWSNTRTVSFSNLGNKSFERIYRLRDVQATDGHQLAIIEMEGAPYSKGIDQLYLQDPKIKVLLDRMDSTCEYKGQLLLDLTSGQVAESQEHLEVRWVALDPRIKLTDQTSEPNTITMRSVQGFRLARLSDDRPKAIRCRLRFEPGRTIQYQAVSRRDIQILWDPNVDPNAQPDKVSRMTESLQMAFGLTPIQVEPNGLTRLQVEIRSVTPSRTRAGQDIPSRSAEPVEALKGRVYTIEVLPTGRIVDANSLDGLLKQIGRLAFRQDPKYGLVKDPEMISDVVAILWFVWDAISCMDPNGTEPGQRWSSRMLLPTPMVSRKARDVEYQLERVEQTANGRIAVINSNYCLSERPAPATWPIPYSGRFRVSGTFGFLGAYRFLGLEGNGLDRFNLDTGIWEQSVQRFHYKVQASMPFAFANTLGSNPLIIVDQNITIELLTKEPGSGV